MKKYLDFIKEILDTQTKRDSYINKANSSLFNMATGKNSDGSIAKIRPKDVSKRTKGIAKAIDKRMRNEELDEVLDTKAGINSFLDKSAEKRKQLTTTSSLDNDNNRKIDKSFKSTHKAIDKLKTIKK